MFSYEDRIQAVKLYIKLGRRLAPTIRQLGYPTKNTLKSWYREYERCRDLLVRSKPRAPTYSTEQKKAAVEHYLSHGRSFVGTRRAFGYSCRPTLTAWIDELHPETRKRVIGKREDTPRPHESKQSAVIELCTRQESARALALRVGVSRQSLYIWKNHLLGREASASVKRLHGSPQALDRAELERKLESLQRSVRRLQLEHDILKKANELLKKDLGVGPQFLTNRATFPRF